mmetsp:Transcript_106833/g.300363  ORF Transcript_106833/g.300363 Transcript_106833/m.300363 type:complete len:203 (-) Transcript_106833:1426-2034(-)
MIVPLSRNFKATSMWAGPRAFQCGWRSRKRSFCCTHIVARRLASRPCVMMCRGPTFGSTMRSRGRNVSVDICFVFKYCTQSRPVAASVTMKASAMPPSDICRGRSKRFCVGSTNSLIRPSTPLGNASRSSSAIRCVTSNCSNFSRRAFAASSLKRKDLCSSSKESLKSEYFCASWATWLTRFLRSCKFDVSLASSNSTLDFS